MISKESIESMADIFEEHGITATVDQIEKAAKDFALHLEMMAEMSSYGHVGGIKKCEDCESLRLEIKNRDYQISVYQDSVKKRRRCSNVYLENGNVMYD